MRDALLLTFSVVLPWAAGTAWLRFLPKSGPLPWAISVGYGHFVGLLALTLCMRATSLAGMKWNFWVLAALVAGFGAVAVAIGRGRMGGALALPAWRDAWAGLGRRQRILAGLLVAAVAVRLAGLLLEIVWRPLFPWDAWVQWATKARVWYAQGYMAPFVTFLEWVNSDAGKMYTDPAPGYPGTVPLLQVWSALAIGRWDDALMNVPWFACAVALAFAFYGQLRAWGTSALLAVLGTYMLMSVPFLDAHVALAGYAELHMAALYGLAAMAFFLWARDGDARQGWLALALALALPLIKKPGIFWVASFIPAYLVVLRPRAATIGLAVAAVAGLGVVFFLRETGLEVFRYALTADVDSREVTQALAQNLFEMGDWNLLFWLLPAMAAVAWRRLLAGPFAPMTVMVAFGVYFLGIVFYFSIAGEWVSDFTTVNRAVFHMVPLAVFWMVALAQRHFLDPPDPPALA
jgi:hypothetical protein